MTNIATDPPNRYLYYHTSASIFLHYFYFLILFARGILRALAYHMLPIFSSLAFSSSILSSALPPPLLIFILIALSSKYVVQNDFSNGEREAKQQAPDTPTDTPTGWDHLTRGKLHRPPPLLPDEHT